jgi:hypothetical protein
MRQVSSWALLFSFLCFLSSCALWEERQAGHSRDQNENLGPVQFNAYHNIRPTRRSGGKFYEIKFLEPKSLKEISLEFVNYKVQIHDLELIKSSGKKVPLKFRSRFLTSSQKHISLRNLSRSKNIVGVRLKAEGHENNDVLFTVSFFSPDGFSPQEQGKSVSLGSFKRSKNLSARDQQIPSCLLGDAKISHVIFESQQLSNFSATEKKYFCSHFIPRFKQLIDQHKAVSQFLRTGEDLEKPLVSLGKSFSYDPHRNQLVFPFKLKNNQFPNISKRLGSYFRSPKKKASRGLSQERGRQYGLKKSYEDYMSSAQGTNLSYGNKQAPGVSHSNQKECQSRLSDLGINSSQAKNHCQDVLGHELEHVACVEFLIDQYVLVGSAHHYCKEAHGKLSLYKPCMSKLLSMEMNHYDSNLFCQRTPAEYMQDQLLCVEEMALTGQSQYKSVRVCQKAWGKEGRLINCLRKAQNTENYKKSAQRCNAQ